VSDLCPHCCQPYRKVREGKPLLALRAMLLSPKTNAELCEVVDEIGPYMARTMSKMIHRGWAVNLSPHRKVGLYRITDAGRAMVERADQ